MDLRGSMWCWGRKGWSNAVKMEAARSSACREMLLNWKHVLGLGFDPWLKKNGLGYPKTRKVPLPQLPPYSCPVHGPWPWVGGVAMAGQEPPSVPEPGKWGCRWQRMGWRVVWGSSSAGNNHVHNQADPSQNSGGTAGAEAGLCLWVNERHSPGLSEQHFSTASNYYYYFLLTWIQICQPF